MKSSQLIADAVRQGVEATNSIATAMTDINSTTSGFVDSSQEMEKSNAEMESIAEKLQESVSIYQT